MNTVIVPGVKWGDCPWEPTIVIDLAEVCAWLGLECDLGTCAELRAVIEAVLLKLFTEATVELGTCCPEEEGVSA